MAVALRVVATAGRASVLRSASLHRRRARWLRPDVVLCVVLYAAALSLWWTGSGVVFEADASVNGSPSADVGPVTPGTDTAPEAVGSATAGVDGGDGGTATGSPRHLATDEAPEVVEEVAVGTDGEVDAGLVDGDAGDVEPIASADGDAVHATADSDASDETDAPADVPDLPLTWSDVGLYLVPAVAGLQALMYLATFWSVDVDCFFAYTRVGTVQRATHVKAVPNPHCGAKAMCSLSKLGEQTPRDCNDDVPRVFADMPTMWFEFQRTSFRVDDGDTDGSATHTVRVLDSPTEELLETYTQWRGHTSATLGLAKQKWGRNEFRIPMPKFMDLLQEHATAPFFVFQVFCVLLWMLDDNWMYSVFTLAMLVVFECLLVHQRMTNLRTLRGMRRPPQPVWVYRRTWTKVSSSRLVPGDLVCVGKSPVITKTITYPLPRNAPRNARPHTATKTIECTAPCDMLLLAGSCVVNEAMLTGESVPQLKEAIHVDEGTSGTRLDVEGGSRRHTGHVVFGGTSVLICNPPSRDETAAAGVGALPDRACLGVVLRTGFGTSQGSLMRTILFSTERVGVGDKQAFAFIGVLLMFAIAAASYVLMEGLEDGRRSRYKLFLHCTLIITSVVPPELPMELSLAITTSLQALIAAGIYCTEPYRIPSAGKVDVCCFDKTGTLTSDRLVVRGVAGVRPAPRRKDQKRGKSRRFDDDDEAEVEEGLVGSMGGIPLTNIKRVPEETLHVLAGCQSLVQVDGEVAGDPMEKATMAAVGWTLAGPGTVKPFGSGLSYASTIGRDRLAVVARHGFDSALKRMSVVVSRTHVPRSPMSIVVKGAPEMIETLLAEVPSTYRSTYRLLMFAGARVLALAWRPVPADVTSTQARAWTREEVECNLVFAGFLVLDCPMKPDTERVLGNLQRSQHRLVMITGDAPLTAVDVAKQLNIMKKQGRTLVLMASSPADTSAGSGAGAGAGAGASPAQTLFWNDISAAEAAVADVHVPFGEQPVLDSTDAQLCVTGAAVAVLMAASAAGGAAGREADSVLSAVAEKAVVFARMSPRHKELLVARLNSLGHTTLMCGDGTNDVGALTQAHIGISIVSSPVMEAKLLRRQERAKKKLGDSGSTSSWAAKLRELEQKVQQEQQSQVIQFGDASIAAPFTSKRPTISSSAAIVRQGRCTLVTTIQMYRILAVHCLVLSYMLSAMYSSGVKSGDTQATFAGLAIAGFFFCLSRSTPLETLADKRPPTSVFCAPAILSVAGQFAVHLACIIYCVRMCQPFQDPDVDPDGEFEPNVLNSAIFLLTSAMQVSSFLVNYQGAPFMVPLREHKALWRGLLAVYAVLFVAALEVLPDFNEMLELVVMPPELKWTLVGLMFVDTAAVWVWETVLRAVVA